MEKVFFFRMLKVLVSTGIVLVVFCAQPVDHHGMAVIKASGKKFTMGQKGLANAAPMEVTLDHDYAIDRTEVTTGFFTQLMGNAPSFFKGDTSKPVENVSFIEAALFCNKRSVKEGLNPCYNYNNWACDRSKNGYRLPSEAEWEYACRAGSKTPFFWGKKKPSRFCWYRGNSNGTTHPVAFVKPNRFGLFDMSGNVWEWCDDRYTPERQAKKDSHWELGPKILRGGSFSSTPNQIGSAVREGGDPMGKSNGVGFRCVKNLYSLILPK